MSLRKAAQQALEALVAMSPSGPTGSAIWHQQMQAIVDLSKALAEPEQQPEQQPVAHSVVEPLRPNEYQRRVSVKWVGRPVSGPLYTAPTPQPDTDCHAQGICQRSGYSIANTQRKPLELTDGEIVQVLGSVRESITGSVFLAFARAVIAAYEAKNGIAGEGAA